MSSQHSALSFKISVLVQFSSALNGKAWKCKNSAHRKWEWNMSQNLYLTWLTCSVIECPAVERANCFGEMNHKFEWKAGVWVRCQLSGAPWNFMTPEMFLFTPYERENLKLTVSEWKLLESFAFIKDLFYCKIECKGVHIGCKKVRLLALMGKNVVPL